MREGLDAQAGRRVDALLGLLFAVIWIVKVCQVWGALWAAVSVP
jgi:hypothetical protein